MSIKQLAMAMSCVWFVAVVPRGTHAAPALAEQATPVAASAAASNAPHASSARPAGGNASAVVASPASTLALATRRAAAEQTASSIRNACAQARPFYWEIGDGHAALVSGRVGEDAPARDTLMSIASASKWLYAAYVAERRQGRLSDEDVRFLTLRSGYTNLRFCREGQTVQACRISLFNGRGKPDPGTSNLFYYNGGHMQEHAARLGLGELAGAALGQAIGQGLGQAMGQAFTLNYSQPLLAGGGVSTAGDYAGFLQALLRGDLKLSTLLGTQSVCASPTACPDQALHTPIPSSEVWHYSIGHWVEDDPRVGDGAFSSPGLFGFYPWISADRQWYGLLARHDRPKLLDKASGQPYVRSAACGRLIRQAWIKGEALP